MASNQQHSLEVIPEISPMNVHVDYDHELEELQENMNYICDQTAQEFYKLTCQSLKVSDILERNFNKTYLNNNFDQQEIIEEQIDKLIYQYTQIKKNLRDGREIRFYMEKKVIQKCNELRYAENLLANLGIDPTLYNYTDQKER